MKWIALALHVVGFVMLWRALSRDRKASMEDLPLVIIQLLAGGVAFIVGAGWLLALVFKGL